MDRTEAAIAEAERAGLRLAIKGRLVAMAALSLWILLTGYFPASLIGFGAVLVFAGLGLLHHFLINSGRERRWHRFVFVSLDAAALGIIAISAPLSAGGDVPQIFAFRAFGLIYAILIIAVTSLSLSPSLVLWAGGSVVAALWAAFGWIVSGMSRTVSWWDLPEAPTREQYLQVFLDPDFIGTGTRVQESIIILCSAAIVALAVSRARHLVRTSVRAEAARENLSRYVSPNLVEKLASAAEPFGPVRRQNAGILFVDIAGFTGFAEHREPEKVIAFLREFHRRMADAVFAHDGTVDDYVGDQVMAVFGTPEAAPDDALRAIRCAHAMRRSINDWNDERIRRGEGPVRVGIGVHYGPVVVGSTGTEARLKFAVVGATVNIASRLQSVTRERNCELIVSVAAAKAAGVTAGEEGIAASLAMRGHAEPISALLFGQRSDA